MTQLDATGPAVSALAKPNISLRRRILLVLFLAGVPGIIVAVFLTVQKLSEETRQIETSVTRLAALGTAQHENVLTGAHTLLEAVSKAQEFQQIDEANCGTYLKGWSDRLVYFTSLTLFDVTGRVICSNIDGQLPYGASGRNWFDKAIGEQRFTVSDYELGQNGMPLLVAALPVLSDAQKTIGVIALGISLSWLDLIGSNVDLPPEGSITVLGPAGRVLTHNGAQPDEGSAIPPPSQDALDSITAQGSGTLRAHDASGATRVYGFNPTKSGGVVVVVGLPQFVEYSEWTNAFIQTLVSPLVVLLLALAAAAWASEAFVVRHVRSLITTADDIASGNLQARSDVDYDEHELGQLAAAMDTMAEAIEENQNELQQKSATHEMIAQEMQHRIGNALALAQAIAAQTIRRANSNEEFIGKFNARLRALSVSNKLLLEDNWKSTDLRELLETVLSAHADAHGKSFAFQGPQVHIDSRTTLAITLAVHELATNALKHGALSRAGGEVCIHWSLSDEDGQPWLLLDWREKGGPRTQTPKRTGFGTQMLRMMVERKLNGRIKQSFAADGLACELAFPWKKPPEG